MVDGSVIDDPHYSTPLYHKTEAAHIIAVPPQTFRDWAVGYAYKRLDGSHVVSAPIVTTLEATRPQGASVPFVGLAEAYIVAAFKKSGVPMRRIRPAVLWLQDHIGLRQALASQRLQTDGAEVLWDFGRTSGDPADQDLVDGLVVVRSGQQVFRPVVRDFLTMVTYEDGWTRRIQLPQYGETEVVVDPWLNGGQPTVSRRGVRVADIVSRLSADEPLEDVAGDYGLTVPEVEAIRQAALSMAGKAAESGLRFFLDRGLGAYVVPKALRAAGWMLETMDERYGADQSQNIRDTQWIEEATLTGDVLLCKDLAIAQNPLEAQVIYMTSARVFGLSNASLAGPVMAQWYLDNEAKIVDAALGAAGPYVIAVNPAYGLRRAKLAYPPD
jgi:uncharacterized protein (DUF433 family)